MITWFCPKKRKRVGACAAISATGLDTPGAHQTHPDKDVGAARRATCW